MGVVGVGFVFVVAFVEFGADVVVHLAAVFPVDEFADEVEFGEGVHFVVGVVPPADLAEHSVGEGIVAGLGSEGGIAWMGVRCL